MKKLILLFCLALLLVSCASFEKTAKYPKGTIENTDWKIRKL